MQLGEPGLELERVYTHPRTKPLDADERGLLAHVLRIQAAPPFPVAARNPDNPIRCWWCPWGKKEIFNTRDVLNRRAEKIIARNAVESRDFARQVMIHLGFTYPEIAEKEKAAGMAGLGMTMDPRLAPTVTEPGGLAPATKTIPVLTTQQPARTIPFDAPAAPAQQPDIAKFIPWALLGLSILRTFR